MKVGYKTTEFWVTVLGNLVALLAALTGKDYSGLVPVVAAGCAVAANAVYTIGRNGLKAATLKSDAAALAHAVGAAAPAAAVAAVEHAVEAAAAPAPEAPAAPAPAA